jgi:hypothetical protein
VVFVLAGCGHSGLTYVHVLLGSAPSYHMLEEETGCKGKKEKTKKQMRICFPWGKEEQKKHEKKNSFHTQKRIEKMREERKKARKIF